jgi:hypothetical protein
LVLLRSVINFELFYGPSYRDRKFVVIVRIRALTPLENHYPVFSIVFAFAGTLLLLNSFAIALFLEQNLFF